MQNKGFVRVFAILLTLVCVFYLSFSFVTRHYAHKAKEFAKRRCESRTGLPRFSVKRESVVRQLDAETMS
mgnify:CR=1 FL=1